MPNSNQKPFDIVRTRTLQKSDRTTANEQLLIAKTLQSPPHQSKNVGHTVVVCLQDLDTFSPLVTVFSHSQGRSVPPGILTANFVVNNVIPMTDTLLWVCICICYNLRMYIYGIVFAYNIRSFDYHSK